MGTITIIFIVFDIIFALISIISAVVSAHDENYEEMCRDIAHAVLFIMLVVGFFLLRCPK